MIKVQAQNQDQEFFREHFLLSSDPFFTKIQKIKKKPINLTPTPLNLYNSSVRNIYNMYTLSNKKVTELGVWVKVGVEWFLLYTTSERDVGRGSAHVSLILIGKK